MNKKNLLNLALVLVVALLATVIYLSEEENTLLDRLTDITPASISNIEIRHNGQLTTIQKQKEKQWQIIDPSPVEANNFRINSILKLINAPIHNHYSAAQADITKLGLSKSKTSITLDDQRITFGDTNPATGLRYISLNGNVYTIEDVYYPLLSSHFGTLASLNLLPQNTSVANGGIEKLILLNQTIAKDKNGLWQSNIDHSADNISKTIRHWQHGQAFGVHEYLERKQLGEVFIYLKGKQNPVSYLITDKEPWLILARPELGLEYHLKIEAYENLIAPQ